MPDDQLSPLPRTETGVPGLDTVLDGGLVVGATCFVLGTPGTGKTTLGNQIAFHHARGGGNVLFTTVLAEPHERMLRRLTTFRFFDRGLVGTKLHYLNLLDTLDDEGSEGLLTVIRREVRAREATLLVVDGISVIEEHAATSVEARRLISRLQVATSLAGCTTLLLSNADPAAIPPVGAQADGILVLSMESTGARDRRSMRVVKFRGTEHLLGRHDVSISRAGLEIHPRVEAVVGRERTAEAPGSRLGTGIPRLDAMLGGGLYPRTSTMVLGTPGSGKTILGLSFLTAGAAVGERGMAATFHESAEGLANTPPAGDDLARAVADGRIEIFWSAPLELSPDAWAWELLRRVERHRPDRLFIDGLSDIHMNLPGERTAAFLTALMNELRRRGVTTLGTVEIDEYVGPELVSPVPAISAMVDNGILLRHVEFRSQLRRMISVLKARQSTTDPSIREFTIGPEGIEVGGRFESAAALLTGAAVSEPASGDDRPVPGPLGGRARS